MESIIIFVIIAIVSSLFQNAGQAAKKQKQATAPVPERKHNDRGGGPQRVKMRSSSQMMNQESKKNVSSSFDPFEGLEINSVISGGGMRGEIQEVEVLSEDIGEIPTSNENDLLQSFSVDDLQKSIIMAEILGKPKAYRNNRM